MKLFTNFTILVIAIGAVSINGFNTNLHARSLATSHGKMTPLTIASTSTTTMFNAKDCDLSLKMAALDVDSNDDSRRRRCFGRVVSYNR